MAERAFVSVYKSPRRDEMYLYMKRGEKMDGLPEALRQQFGTPMHVMDLVLTPERKLARAEAPKVLDSIRDKGFYLQMPPPADDASPNTSAYLQSPESGSSH